MTDEHTRLHVKRPDLLVQGLTVLACVAGPCIGFFYGVGAKLESVETKQAEQFERLRDDFHTLERRLERDEEMLYEKLDGMDVRLRHVEQLTSRMGEE